MNNLLQKKLSQAVVAQTIQPSGSIVDIIEFYNAKSTLPQPQSCEVTR